MRRLIRYLTAALVAAWVLPALSQTDTFGLDAGEYSVGFRLIEEQDSSRVVSGGVRGATHPRPIRVYLWYPAAAARRAEPVRFGRYAALADDDVWPAEIAGELRERLKYANGPLARSLSAADFEALLARPMRAVENAEPAGGSVSAARDRPRPLLRIAGHVRRAGRVSGRPRLRRSDGATRRHAHRNREAHRAGSRNADSRSRIRHRPYAATCVRRSGTPGRHRLRPRRHGGRGAHDAQPRRRRVRELGLRHSISAIVGASARVATLR